MTDEKNLPDCCKPKKKYEGNSVAKGIMYGIIPHTGCILFIIASVLGATILMQYFKPLLMNRNIFYYLILISIGFATISSIVYLRNHKLLNLGGIKKKKGYLSIMYGSTIGINLILFFFVFPVTANLTSGINEENIEGLSLLKISVDIPCPGHAPLITNEVKTIEGVKGSEYSFPDNFDVYYDESITSPEEILSLEVFDEYPATILNEISEPVYQEIKTESKSYSGGICQGGCGGPGTCGGSCGSPACSYN